MDLIKELMKKTVQLADSKLEVRYRDSIAEVGLPGGRTQKVNILRDGSWYRMTSTVVGADTVAKLRDKTGLFLQHLWRKNLHTDFVNFTFDRQGRLVGRIDQLAQTMQPEEFFFAIGRLAIECDRLEFILTGRNRF